jgi:hypothetical protein
MPQQKGASITHQFALLFLMRDIASRTCLMGVFLVVAESGGPIFLMGEYSSVFVLELF